MKTGTMPTRTMPPRTGNAGKILLPSLFLIGCLIGLGACAPEVGSERWCKNLAEKPKGDWTANEALAYAENCLID